MKRAEYKRGLPSQENPSLRLRFQAGFYGWRSTTVKIKIPPPR